MGKITRHGGASRQVFEQPRTPADVLRQRGKLGPYPGGKGARVETFTAPDPEPLPEAVEGDQVEREHPGTGAPMEPVEATPDGTEHELTAAEPAPRKRARKGTAGGRKRG